MALSSIVKTGHDAGTLQLIDGTGTPLTLTVRWDKADLNVGDVSGTMREVVAVVGRGKLRSLRRGAPKFPSISFSVHVTEFSETGTGTVLDWEAKKTGTPFASRVSTTASIGDADTYHVKFTMEGTTYGDAADSILQFKDCNGSWSFAEGEDGNTLSFSGTVYGDITDGTSTVFTAPRG